MTCLRISLPIAISLLISGCASTAPVPLPQDGLRAVYPFDGNALDVSGHQNHGTIFGASLTRDRFGNDRSAVAFDGVDDHIVIPHTHGLDQGGAFPSFSLSFWFRAETPRLSRMIEKWDEALSTPYPFAVQVDRSSLSAVTYDGSQRLGVTLGRPWDGVWHHAVIVFDSQAASLAAFLDGRLVSMQRVTYAASTRNTVAIIIGAGPHVDRFYRGQFDDLRIYGRALTEKQILELLHEKGWSG